MNNKINIHFLGDADTGSKYLLKTLDKRIMIDCGHFPEPADWSELKWLSPPVKVEEINLAVFPCAHLNHEDLLPKLMESGFRGRLLSAAYKAGIQQQKTTFWPDATWNFTSRPTETLARLNSIEETFDRFRTTPEGIWITLDSQVRLRFHCAEELPAYVFLELNVQDERLFLTGEVGRRKESLLSEGNQIEEPALSYEESSVHSLESPRSTPESSFWLG